MQNFVELELRYSVNGNDYGKVSYTIDKDAKYRAFVTLYGKCVVELL